MSLQAVANFLRKHKFSGELKNIFLPIRLWIYFAISLKAPESIKENYSYSSPKIIILYTRKWNNILTINFVSISFILWSIYTRTFDALNHLVTL